MLMRTAMKIIIYYIPIYIMNVHMYNMTYENTLFYFVFHARTIRYVILYNIIINRWKSIFPYYKRRIYREMLTRKEGPRRTFAANDLLCVWECKKNKTFIFNRRYEYYYFTGQNYICHCGVRYMKDKRPKYDNN